MVFDSTPVSFDDMSTASSSSRGKKSKSLRSALAPLSPQSFSAEIEQLDAAVANLASGEKSGMGNTNGGDALRISRKMRNVKQPVSYAEPSTKSKLRRGVSDE